MSSTSGSPFPPVQVTDDGSLWSRGHSRSFKQKENVSPEGQRGGMWECADMAWNFGLKLCGRFTAGWTKGLDTIKLCATIMWNSKSFALFSWIENIDHNCIHWALCVNMKSIMLKMWSNDFADIVVQIRLNRGVTSTAVILIYIPGIPDLSTVCDSLFFAQ